MKRFLLLLPLILFACSAEDQPKDELEPVQYFMAKLKPECVTDAFSQHCIPGTEYDRLTEEWEGTCMTVTFTDLEGNTITGILRGLETTAETDEYCAPPGDTSGF